MKRLGLLLGVLLLLGIAGFASADEGTARVSGTEYGLSENGTIYAQVLYLNGTPANDATLNLTLWSPGGVAIIDDVNMEYVTGSSGVYSYNFTTPAVAGVYVADIISANPTGYGTDEIHVSEAGAGGNGTTPAAVWSEPIVGYTDEGTFGGLINDFLGGGNMLLIGMVGLLALLMIAGFWRRSQAILWVASLTWIGFAFWQRSLTPAWGTWDLHEILFYIGFLMAIVCIVEAVMIYREGLPVAEKPAKVDTADAYWARYDRMMHNVRKMSTRVRR